MRLFDRTTRSVSLTLLGGRFLEEMRGLVATLVGVKLDKPAISRTIGIVRRAGRSLLPSGEALAKLLTQASRATAKTIRR